MKPVEEIGVKKSIKFLIFSLVYPVYRLMFLPPMRKLFLILFGAKIGSHSILMEVKFFNWHHKGFSGLSIGKECFIGDETLIDLYNKVTLEDQVTIAQRVNILTHLNVGYSTHPLQKFFPKMSAPVIFQRGCVVAASATILPGVTVGSGSFVAAGSMVNKNVPENCLVAGVPAKVVRKIQ